MARKKRSVVGDEADFQQLIKEGKIEIVCKTGPTIEERVEGLQTLRRRFCDSPINDTHTRDLALGWWHGYPMLFVGIANLPAYTTIQREMLIGLLNGVHESAVQFLMRLAVKHGIDAGALWAEGSLCRELFQHQELWNIDAKSRSSPNWPDCLGRSRYKLSPEECLIIREGENAFRRLLIQPQAARDAAESIKPEVVVEDQGREEDLDGLPLDDTPGLRTAYRRDHLWLRWHGKGLGPAAIRDRWNGLDETNRKAISPRCFESFTFDRNAGANRVKTALLKARREQKEHKPKRTPDKSQRSRSNKKN